MNKFSHVSVASADEAIPLLGVEARPIAGGTDLLPLMKDELVEPATLLDLKRVTDLRFIREDVDGIHIGALTTLDDLDRSPIVRSRYTALAEAAALAASPQLRNMATLGGNLLQQVRCWYYRGDFLCWLKGGDICHARPGENQYHAIFDRSPCVAVHPSDPPVVLVALDARLHIAGPQGKRTIAVADFLQPPTDERRALHTLGPDELITEVVVPPSAGRSTYLKVMDRAVWAYALTSVAVAGRLDGQTLRDVRIVLGAVANVPLRVTAAEVLLEGQPIDDGLLRRAGEVAIQGATPLARNGYKLLLAQNIVAQSLRDLAAQGTAG